MSETTKPVDRKTRLRDERNERDERIVDGIVDRLDRRAGNGRRSTDLSSSSTTNPDSGFVDHVRAADTGLRMGRGWLEILLMLVGFGVAIGTAQARFNAQEKAFDDFKTEMRISVEKAATAAQSAGGAAHDLSMKVDLLERWQDRKTDDDKVRDLQIGKHDAWIEAQKQLLKR